MSSDSQNPPSCRQIEDGDVDGVAGLLARGFPERTYEYWRQVLDRLAKHSGPKDMPKYGYLLEASAPVGVVLVISSIIREGDATRIRCNISSWYVEPEFRIYAAVLISQAMKKRNIEYIQLTPAPHVVPIVEAQGYSRFTNGLFVAPVLPIIRGCSAKIVAYDIIPDAHFEPFERDLLLAHGEYGCTSFWCVASGTAYPFVFLPRVLKRFVPCAHLLYCPNIETFVRFARPIGVYLGLRGKPFFLIDSNGPIRGLPGKYFDGMSPKYFKGPVPPRLGNLAYTEVAIFPDLLNPPRR